MSGIFPREVPNTKYEREASPGRTGKACVCANQHEAKGDGLLEGCLLPSIFCPRRTPRPFAALRRACVSSCFVALGSGRSQAGAFIRHGVRVGEFSPLTTPHALWGPHPSARAICELLTGFSVPRARRGRNPSRVGGQDTTSSAPGRKS